MKLKDIKTNAPDSLTAGLNHMTLSEFTFEDGKYGRQIRFVFSHPYVTKEGEEKELQKFYWTQLVGPVEDQKSLWKLTAKLHSFVDVLACVAPDAEDIYNDLIENTEEFDERSQQIVEVQETFLSSLLQPVLGNQVPVVLHYSGEHLNIPTEKQNGWKLPFGKNPQMGSNLVLQQESSTEPLPIPAVEHSGWGN